MRIKFGDRVAASFLIFVASLITATIIWAFVFIFVGRAGELFVFPFSFVLYSCAGFTVLAFLLPNRSIDCIGWVWNKIDVFIKSLRNENGP
jgi:hypothetical protein